MRVFLESKKTFIELWIISVISGFFFAMTSDGGLCMMLLNGAGIKHRCVLAVILAVMLWCVTAGLRIAAERIDRLQGIRKVSYALLERKSALFWFSLSALRLNQAAFYPLYAESKIYFVSYALFGVYLAFVVLSHVTVHEKFRKAVAVTTLLCSAGWCVSRLLQKWDAAYDAFYYCVLLSNMVAMCKFVCNITAKGCIEKAKDWLLRNKGSLLFCLLAAAAGCGIEIVRTCFNGAQLLLPRCAFFASMGFCLAACVVFYRKKEAFAERTFLCVILTVGIFMAVFMPLSTGVSWDDQIHYTHTIELVQGEHMTEADNSLVWIEMGHPKSEISLADRKAYFHLLEEKENYQADVLLSIDVLFHQRIGYLPNIIGLCFGKILNLPYGITFVLGRIGGLVFYALIMFAAMKRLHSGKLLVAVVALLPTNMFQAANYTYDAWIVCMVVLAISIFISWLQDAEKQISAGDAILVLALMTLAISPKGIYFPLFLLFQLIPAAKFADCRQYRNYLKWVLGTMFTCFLAYMLLPFIGGNSQGDVRFGTEVSATGQIRYILQNPVTYAKNLVLFLKSYLSLENTHDYTCFWAYLSHYRTDYHTTLVMLLFATAILDRGDCEQIYNTGAVKIGTVVVLYGIAAMIATVLYLTCSPVGSDAIAGCQPRYLAPLVFPFLLLVCNWGSFYAKRKELLQAVILSWSGYVVFIITWVNLTSRYIA